MRKFLLVAVLVAAYGSLSHAAGAAPVQLAQASTDANAAASTERTDGEVRKIDKSAKKITLKHGEIKKLGMPPMTMVFQVQDIAVLDKVKVGDTVQFSVEQVGGAMVVTNIGAVK